MGAENNSASSRSYFHSDSFLPQADANLQDLDARDANNQPIKDNALKNELESIFTSGLNALLLQSNLYPFARTLSLISQKLMLASSSLVPLLPSPLRDLFSVLRTSIKKLDAMRLTVVKVAGNSAGFLMSAVKPFGIELLPAVSSTCVLRC